MWLEGRAHISCSGKHHMETNSGHSACAGGIFSLFDLMNFALYILCILFRHHCAMSSVAAEGRCDCSSAVSSIDRHVLWAQAAVRSTLTVFCCSHWGQSRCFVVPPALYRHCSTGVQLSALLTSFFTDKNAILCRWCPRSALSFHSHHLPSNRGCNVTGEICGCMSSSEASCHLYHEKHRHGHRSAVGFYVIFLHKNLPKLTDE